MGDLLNERVAKITNVYVCMYVHVCTKIGGNDWQFLHRRRPSQEDFCITEFVGFLQGQHLPWMAKILLPLLVSLLKILLFLLVIDNAN